MPLFSLKCLDPGSGRKIPAIRHAGGAYPLFFTRNLVLFLAWLSSVSILAPQPPGNTLLDPKQHISDVERKERLYIKGDLLSTF